MDTKDKIQIAMMAVICLFLMTLIVAIVFLVKNVDAIKNDPVQYAIEKEIYNSCSCYQGQDRYEFGDTSKQLVIQNWSG